MKSRWREAARGAAALRPLMQAAAKILRQDGGPNIAAVEFSGWDTHANQGLAGGALDRLLGQLAEGLMAFRTDMGAAWANTTVVVMTEFGRTARPNGTRGTDHGTAGAGFIIGPKVAKSTVHADWPGLGDRALFEGRDLKPTLDTRAVLKAAIAAAFDLTPAQAERVFPGSERRARRVRTDGVKSHCSAVSRHRGTEQRDLDADVAPRRAREMHISVSSISGLRGSPCLLC